jgi:hypothetical protein
MPDLRDKVLLELHKEDHTQQEHHQQPLQNHHHHVERLQHLARAMTRSTDFVTITGPGGSPIYAYGNKNVAIDYGDPASWIINQAQENVWLRAHPSIDSELPTCPIQEVSMAEIHWGDQEIYRLCDSRRTKCVEVNDDIITYCFVFDKKQGRGAEKVSLVLVLKFGPILNYNSRRVLCRDMENVDFHTNPLRFQNEEIQHVWFNNLTFLVNSDSSRQEGTTTALGCP